MLSTPDPRYQYICPSGLPISVTNDMRSQSTRRGAAAINLRPPMLGSGYFTPHALQGFQSQTSVASDTRRSATVNIAAAAGRIIFSRRTLVVPPSTGSQTSSAGLPTYRNQIEFDPMTMKYFVDGFDAEYKDDVRKRMCQTPELCDPPTFANWNADREHLQVIEKLRKLLADGSLLSVSHLVSTPRKFLSFYEVCASMDANMALSAASHYSRAANIVSLHDVMIDKESNAKTPKEEGMSEGMTTTISSRRLAWQTQVDRMQIVCGAPLGEVGCEQPPFLTTATTDGSGFRLSSDVRREDIRSPSLGHQFNVVNGSTADYVLLPARRMDHLSDRGTAFCLVKTRVGGQTSNKKLAVGVQCKPTGRTGALDGAGLCSMSLDNVMLSSDDVLMWPFEFANVQSQLAMSSVAMGVGKRLIREVVYWAASRKVRGAFGEHGHPLFSLQLTQNEIMKHVAVFYCLVAAFYKISSRFCTVSITPNAEDRLDLACLNAELGAWLRQVASTERQIAGGHGLSTLNASNQADAIASFMADPQSRACHGPVMMCSLTAIRDHVRTGSSGARFKHRWFANPFFSPVSSEIARYIILFRDYETVLRHRLNRALNNADRSNPEDAFMIWNNEVHRDALEFGKAYGTSLLLRSMLDEVIACKDPQNRRVLRDLAWLVALNRMHECGPGLLQDKLIGSRGATMLLKQLDSVSGVLSPQAVHLVDAFSIPAPFRHGPIGKNWEEHYVIRS